MNPKILQFSKEDETFRFKDDSGNWQDINQFDTINSFDQTDSVISDKLFDIADIFTNSTVGDISKEMECFYLTINIAGVFGGRFKDKF